MPRDSKSEKTLQMATKLIEGGFLRKLGKLGFATEASSEYKMLQEELFPWLRREIARVYDLGWGRGYDVGLHSIPATS